jgi:hypothetical protein
MLGLGMLVSPPRGPKKGKNYPYIALILISSLYIVFQRFFDCGFRVIAGKVEVP